jgi:hypothetical protein
MANRRISIDYDFRPDEPSGSHASQIRQAFGELGWTVTQYGGGSSNVHRCYLDIESADHQLDHPTLIATLKRLGIPLTQDPSVYTSISGDVSMERRSFDWPRCREADVGDVHVEVVDVTPRGPIQWKGRLVPQVGVRCIVSPCGNEYLKVPLCMEVTALGEDDKPLGSGLRTYSGPLSRPGETVCELPVEREVATVNLLVRILDIHRAGEVMFRSVPVTSSRMS